MMGYIMKTPKHLATLVSLAMFVIIWHLYALWFGHALVFPTPLKVLTALFELLGTLETYLIVAATLRRLMIAATIATFTGYLTGLMAGRYEVVEGLLRPWVTGLRTLPVVSIIVILLVLLPVRNQVVYVITFLMLYPLIYEAARQSVLHMPTDLNDVLALEPTSFWYRTIHIDMPLSLPDVKTTALQSVGLGFKVIITAEFISQARPSVGRILYLGTESIDYTPVFAWTLLIIIIVAGVEMLLQKLKTQSSRGK